MKENEVYYMAIHENLSSRERIYQHAIHSQNARSGRGARRAALIAAACLILALAAVACIPAARAAVLSWLRPAVDPGAYLHTPAEQRQSVPALDAAIEAAAMEGVTIRVAEAKDERWQAWADKLSIEFDEILYDGEMVYLRCRLRGNTADLVKPTTDYIRTENAQGVTASLPDDTVICLVNYAVNTAPLRRSHFDTSISLFGSDKAAEYIDKGEIPFVIQLDAGRDLTGAQRLTLELAFIDYASLRECEFNPNVDLNPFQVKLRIEGLRFDATAGTEANRALPGARSVALGGETLVFAEEKQPDGTALVGNDRVSLDGGALSVLHMRQQIGGTAMTICLTMPESWTKAQCAFMADRASVELVADGENQGGFGEAYTGIQFYDNADMLKALGIENPPDLTNPHNLVFTIETGLLPADWARMQSLSLLLCVDELTVYNGAALPEGGRVPVAVERDGWSEELETRRFSQYPLHLK